MWLIKSINGWLIRHQICWKDFVKIFDITSNIKLFAYDTLLYGLVHNSDDAISLQSDLDKFRDRAEGGAGGGGGVFFARIKTN